MMKQPIDLFSYAGHICAKMKKGVLLTTASGGKINTMTIGWGKIGIEWGKPVFLAYVRESRFTKRLLDENAEFTINIPIDGVEAKILQFCGTESGAEHDKIAQMHLTPVEANVISVPGIKELPLTLECAVIYTQKQDPAAMPADILERFYPEGADGNRDCHIAYYGEIVDAYLIHD